MKYILFLLVCLNSAILFSQDETFQLIARNSGSDTLWDGTVIRTMGFAMGLSENVTIPGPTLTFTEGDSIEIDLWNISQGAPHTIHLHGLDVDQQNDGVGHLSFFVHHMDHGYYRFRAPHPGAYLYHCHVVSPVHVQGGMYGLIIVKSEDHQYTWTNGIKYHREYNWLTSEVDSNWHKKSIIEHKFDTNGHFTMTLPIYNPQFFLINGKSEMELDEPSQVFMAKANETVYLRLANIGNYGNTYIFPSGLNAQVISSDGREIPVYELTDTLEMYPGERFGVILNPTEEFQDSILIQFTDMNTQVVVNEQWISLSIQGFLSLEEHDLKPTVLIYPNPTSDGQFTVEWGELDVNEIRIFNSSGQIIYSELVSDQSQLKQVKIDQPNGIYLITLRTDELIFNRKLLIR